MGTVGKRSLASVTAKALGWDALFADQIFVDLTKQDILSYVKVHGWDDFRLKEAQIIAWLLSRYPTNMVIACGGGVVEREESRQLLKTFAQTKGPVIHVLRQKEDVLSFLENNTSSYPDYSRTTAAERWDIREQYYRECSSHDFFSLSVSMPRSSSSSIPLPLPSSSSTSLPTPSNVSELTSLALKPVETTFLRLLRFIVGTDTNHLPAGPTSPRTFLLSLTFPDLNEAIPLIDEISVGIDCWEIRLDWLRSVDHTFIALQVALLRRHSDLPIRLTTRTRSQGGRFPDFDSTAVPSAAATPTANTTNTAGGEIDRQKQMYDLVMLAYKLGCEYVDLELSWPEHMLLSLIANRGNTKVIGSWHDTAGRITWTGRETREIYEKGARLGVDMIEIINTARMSEDNITLRTFVDQVAHRGTPLIAFNMGPEVCLLFIAFLFSMLKRDDFICVRWQGKLSRITNHVLTAISHSKLPSVAAPGQISYAETQSTLYLIGSLPQQSFFLFGSPIAHSLSPILHRSAFSALTLPHHFTSIPAGLGEQDLVRLKEIVSRPDFGGAAVTIPLKIAAMSLCRKVSYHARVIGAVNSLIPISTPGIPTPSISSPSSSTANLNLLPRSSPASDGNGNAGLYGENTDWRGIKTCISRCINPFNAVTSSTTALVIGAGGTSRAAIYALHQLGVANILVWNRTRSKAHAIVDELGKRLRDPTLGGAPFLRLGVLEGGLDAENVKRALSPLPPPTIIISTIPASVDSSSSSTPTNSSSFSTSSSSGGGPSSSMTEQDEPRGVGTIPDVGLRRDVLDLSPAGGVAVELAYQPRKTPLLALVDQVNAFPMPLMSRPPSPGSVVGSNAPATSGETSTSAVGSGSGGIGGGSALGITTTAGIPKRLKHAHTHLSGGRPAAVPSSSSSPYSSHSGSGASSPGKAAPWVGVEGVEILLEQGYEQVRLWTSRRAPQAKIRSEVLKEFERHVQQGLA